MENRKYTGCKYLTVDSLIIDRSMSILYDVMQELTGGLAHIVCDDNNLDDESLRFVLNECKKEENKDNDNARICTVICESLLRLSLQQRQFTFAMIEETDSEKIENLYMQCLFGNCNECCDRCPYKSLYNDFIAGNNK